MFDPYAKKNHHYVPQFWQRRFAGQNGSLWTCRDGRILQRGPATMMSEDWLYTTFDERGMASNALEDGLSAIESSAARIMRSLDSPGALGTEAEQIEFRYFVTLTACRHPDTLSRGQRAAAELAFLFADVHSMSSEEFRLAVAARGISLANPQALYDMLKRQSESALLEQAEEVESLAPTDPALPAHLALHPEAVERVFLSLGMLTITILDAPTGEYFIIGDTPLAPPLQLGFTIPLSCTMALLWEAGATELFRPWTRRKAATEEIRHSNRIQSENALKNVIGPTEAALRPFCS